MRRLSEILAFPKAWYRRTLVRRLFLGEFKTTSFHSAETTAAAAAPSVVEAGVRKATLAPGAAVNVGKQGWKMFLRCFCGSWIFWNHTGLPTYSDTRTVNFRDRTTS